MGGAVRVCGLPPLKSADVDCRINSVSGIMNENCGGSAKRVN
jgi:hypothetical protein